MAGTGLGRLLSHPALGRTRRRIKRLLIALSERILGRQSLHGRVGRSGLYTLAIPGLAGPYLLTRGQVSVSGWAVDLDQGRTLAIRARLDGRRIDADTVERADVVVALSALATLPLRCGAALDVTVRTGPHLLRVEVEAEPGRWSEIFRCAVFCAATDFGTFDWGGLWRYPAWRERAAAFAEADAQDQRDYAAMVGGRPSVTAIILGEETNPLAATRRSLDAQTFGAWTAVVVGGGGEAGAASLRDALRDATGDYVLPLRAGDRLAPDALYQLAAAAQACPALDLIYADEENDTAGADPLPFFKPGWSPDTLGCFDCLGAPALFRTALARDLPAETAYDLALRFAELGPRVRHVPKVLCRRERSALAPADPAGDIRALAGHIERTGRVGTVRGIRPDLAGYRCDVAPPRPRPLVSVVIPTAGRDVEVAGRWRDLVVECVRGIRERSTYREVEIIVVVNADLPVAKAEALAALGCRTVLYGDQVFNVARKLNLGATLATGDLLLLLNDDVEIITEDWIDRLVAQAVRPHVGVVGGKLLYPDGTVQHAGVVTLHGNPGHPRRGHPDEDLGYFLSAAGVRNYAAVTGACMMSRTEVFRSVGGYSEAFPVHFNDVDYCFKVRRLGLHVVYEPACRLYHFESASRVPSIHPDELALFGERWPDVAVDDPFYANAAFGTAPPMFEIFPRAATHVP